MSCSSSSVCVGADSSALGRASEASAGGGGLAVPLLSESSTAAFSVEMEELVAAVSESCGSGQAVPRQPNPEEREM